MAIQNPNFKIFIRSCHSYYKFEKFDKPKLVGRLSYTSGKESGDNDYDVKIKDAYALGRDGKFKGDFNGDDRVSVNESKFYVMLNYQNALLEDTSFFIKKNGNKQSLSGKIMNEINCEK